MFCVLLYFISIRCMQQFSTFTYCMLPFGLDFQALTFLSDNVDWNRCMCGKAMCSLMEFISRTECQASRISLCFQFHFVDLSMISTSSRSISCWWNMWCCASNEFYLALLWLLCVLWHAFLVRVKSGKCKHLGNHWGRSRRFHCFSWSWHKNNKTRRWIHRRLC